VKKSDYIKIIKAQVGKFNEFNAVKKGDWAEVTKGQKGFKQGSIVNIESVVRESAKVRKQNKSKIGVVPIANLEKIYMIELSEEENSWIPIKFKDKYQLSERTERDFKDLYEHLQERVGTIYAKEFMKPNAEGVPVPVIDPPIVEAEILKPGWENKQGFVAMFGPDKGTLFVNAVANTDVDEVIAHEFKHLMSYASKDLAESENRPELQLGIFDEEQDMEALQEKAEKQRAEDTQWEVINRRPRSQEDKLMQERLDYFTKVAEMFAHSEQMLWVIKKAKLKELRAAAKRPYDSEEEKNEVLARINAKQPIDYREQVLATFIGKMRQKYGVRGDIAEEIYEAIFDNLDYYLSTMPEGDKVKLYFPLQVTSPQSEDKEFRGLKQKDLEDKGYEISQERFI